MSYQLSTLDRAFALIGVLADAGDGMRLKELGERLETHPTTLLRTLRVLEQHGVVRRSGEPASYSLGPRLAELGKAAASKLNFVKDGRYIAEDLALRFTVTAHVSLLFDGMLTVVDKVDPRELIVRYSSVGTRMPLHATAAGKAVLALLGPTKFADLGVIEPLASYTPQTVDQLPNLTEEVELSKSRGYSIEREEFQVGFACVGSALSVDGEVFGLSLSGPVTSDEELNRRGKALREAVSDFVASHNVFAVGI